MCATGWFPFSVKCGCNTATRLTNNRFHNSISLTWMSFKPTPHYYDSSYMGDKIPHQDYCCLILSVYFCRSIQDASCLNV